MIASKVLENVNVFRHHRQLRKHFPYRPDALKAAQLKALRKLLVYAYNRFEFYRNMMDGVDFQPHKMRDIEEIQKLPVIDKSKYREFVESIVSMDPSLYERKYRSYSTSGSTGLPLKFYRTWGESAYLKAKFLRALTCNGFGPFDVTYWALTPERATQRTSLVQRMGIMPLYPVSYLDTVENLFERYAECKANTLISVKSTLVQLALHIKRHNITIPKPKLCACLGETLDVNSKRLIMEVFGTENLIDVYGAVEFSTLAFQSKGQEFFHFGHDTNILELDDNGEINQKHGNCIITDLYIYSFPLIRYKLGDWLEMDDVGGVSVIKMIAGRMDDWLIFKNGTRMSFHAFKVILGRHFEVLQFRVIQESYDRIRILAVLRPDADREKVENILVSELCAEVSDHVTYVVQFVDALPPDPNGKVRMLISKVGETSGLMS